MSVSRRGRRPLSGVRIVSLAQNVPGPVAVARLVAQGAVATKVEPPTGDPLRAYSARWYRTLHRAVDVRRLDLKTASGQRALEALLGEATLLLTGQRPAALVRLGLGWRAVSTRHPHLRLVRIVGDTSEPEVPGHDLTYQASAGLVDAGMPRVLLADLFGAERAIEAALLLLRQPAPAHATVGLRDALTPVAQAWRLGLTAPPGLLGGGLPAYRVYETRRGRVAVAALEPHFRERLYTLLARPDGADLSTVMRTRTARQWQHWAERHDLPITAVDDAATARVNRRSGV